MKLITALLLLTSVLLTAQPRIWTNSAGKKIKAELISADDTSITLKFPGKTKTYTVPIDTLSQKDQDYIKQWKENEKERLAEQAKEAEERKKQALVINGTQLTPMNIHRLKDLPVSKSAQRKHGTDTYDAGILLPRDFDPAKQYTLVQVFFASGDPIGGLGAHKSLADKHQCVIIAVHNHKNGGKTTAPYHEFYNLLEEKWNMQKNNWTVIHTGFSGGAKRACANANLPADHGLTLIGGFLSGVNENWLDKGLDNADKKSAVRKQYKKMAIFLCSGTKDDIATPAHHQKVETLVKKSGVKNTKIHTFEGGHNPNWGALPEAVQWIRKNSGDKE